MAASQQFSSAPRAPLERASASAPAVAMQRPRRRVRTWLRSMYNSTPRIIDGWNDLIDDLEPPTGTLERFAWLHPETRKDYAPLVWEALLQWIRMRGRRECARWPDGFGWSLCQPSLAVDELWRQVKDAPLAPQTLPAQVDAMGRIPVRGQQSLTNLRVTL